MSAERAVTTKKRTSSAWLLLKVLCILLGFMFATAIALVWAHPGIIKAPAIVNSPPVGGPTGDQPGQKLTALETEIATEDKVVAAEKDDLSHLNDLTKVLMTIAGVFALLLGAASWKALDDQRRAASENIDLQKENFDQKLKGLLDASRDSLDGVRELRDELDILHGLEIACSRLEPEDNTYSKLLWDEEQRILFYENAVTTALLLNTYEYSVQLSEIYRLLGVFYGSRFYAKKLPDDLDRSRFYFDRSLDLNSSNYATYIHAGHFTHYSKDKVLTTTR
jgi:hypothetical protein